MNSISIGLQNDIYFPDGGWMYIGDDPPDIPRARHFDITRHSLNPLKGIDPKKARELADVLYTIYPQGENTLTVRNGRRDLLKALLAKPLDRKPYRLDRLTTTSDEVQALVDDILLSPILRGVVCGSKPFSFASNTRFTKTKIIVRLDRSEIGDFNALVIGLLLINHFKGQIIIPDFGFYGRDAHVNLIRENRLIAGVHFLGELPPRLRQAVLLVKDKSARHALYDDAYLLAQMLGKAPHTMEFIEEVEKAMKA